MKDSELYTHLLGLHRPWVVAEVKLDAVRQEVCVRVDYDPAQGAPVALSVAKPEVSTIIVKSVVGGIWIRVGSRLGW